MNMDEYHKELELDLLRKDAERYRWLRDVQNSGEFTLTINRRALEGGGAELDQVIDAAIAKGVK